MLKKGGLLIAVMVLAGGLSACASKYGIPEGGPHFASWRHLQYSTRGGEKPRLTKDEMKLAKQQGWWGEAVQYNIDELE